jgi:uncharacterized membrane-anchored protein YhcB (DUF1043 family)
MKLTKEQVNYLKTKQAFQNEGIVGKIFARLLKKKLKNNTDFKKAVDSFDTAQDRMRKSIIDAEKSGVKIPNELKKYAGL